MNKPSKTRQGGYSVVSLLFVAIVLAVLGVIVAQVVPTLIEYRAIERAAKKASDGASVVEVRNLFDKTASIDNITSITGKDLEVTKEDDQVVVRFAYQREIHLVGPAYLTLKYSGQSR